MSNDSSGWVTLAILGRPRGIRGELTAISMSSHPERFQQLSRVTLFPETGEPAHFDVERIWDHQGVLVFKFAGIDSMDDAEPWRGAEVRVPISERIQLDPGEYFHSDLVGCEVRDRLTGRIIGKVTEFQDYGGPPLLEVDDGRLLIPFVKAICVDIRPAEKLIVVDLPKGLEDIGKA